MELAGYTSRVGTMQKIFEDVQVERYERPALHDKEDLLDKLQGTELVFQNGAPLIQGNFFILDFCIVCCIRV